MVSCHEASTQLEQIMNIGVAHKTADDMAEARPAYDANTGRMQILVGPHPVYTFRTQEDYRRFCLAAHAMEHPLST